MAVGAPAVEIVMAEQFGFYYPRNLFEVGFGKIENGISPYCLLEYDTSGFNIRADERKNRRKMAMRYVCQEAEW